MDASQDAATNLVEITSDTFRPVDLKALAAGDAGFSKVAFGALLTYSQSWFSQGVTLGQLLHSVALAPGESTRLAVVDWSRRSRAGETEIISEEDELANDTSHNRAISEVTNAVATEAQSGFSHSSTFSTSTEAGASQAVDISSPLGGLLGGVGVSQGGVHLERHGHRDGRQLLELVRPARGRHDDGPADRRPNAPERALVPYQAGIGGQGGRPVRARERLDAGAGELQPHACPDRAVLRGRPGPPRRPDPGQGRTGRLHPGEAHGLRRRGTHPALPRRARTRRAQSAGSRRPRRPRRHRGPPRREADLHGARRDREAVRRDRSPQARHRRHDGGGARCDPQGGGRQGGREGGRQGRRVQDGREGGHRRGPGGHRWRRQRRGRRRRAQAGRQGPSGRGVAHSHPAGERDDVGRRSGGAHRTPPRRGDPPRRFDLALPPDRCHHRARLRRRDRVATPDDGLHPAGRPDRHDRQRDGSHPAQRRDAHRPPWCQPGGRHRGKTRAHAEPQRRALPGRAAVRHDPAGPPDRHATRDHQDGCRRREPRPTPDRQPALLQPGGPALTRRGAARAAALRTEPEDRVGKASAARPSPRRCRSPRSSTRCRSAIVGNYLAFRLSVDQAYDLRWKEWLEDHGVRGREPGQAGHRAARHGRRLRRGRPRPVECGGEARHHPVLGLAGLADPAPADGDRRDPDRLARDRPRTPRRAAVESRSSTSRPRRRCPIRSGRRRSCRPSRTAACSAT